MPPWCEFRQPERLRATEWPISPAGRRSGHKSPIQDDLYSDFGRALGYSIFTEGETSDKLRSNLLEAVSLHFADAEMRRRLVQMHYQASG